MRKGSSYEALELGIRGALQGVMNYYEVDVTNNFFVEILDEVVKEIKEGKNIMLYGQRK